MDYRMDAQGKIRFVVLTTQRSGSTWVMSVLNNMKDTNAQGELFLRRARGKAKRWDSGFGYPRFVETKLRGAAMRPFSIFSYLDSLYRTDRVVGFKLMYDQLRAYPEIFPYLIWRRVRVVHLIRRNHLDVIISSCMKAQLGRAHLLDGQKAPENVPVELDTDNLVRRLRHLTLKQRMARSLLRLNSVPYTEVAYEDLLADSGNFHRMWDFLGIDPDGRALSTNLVKIRRGGHADVIRNYDQVKEVLAESGFAHLIDPHDSEEERYPERQASLG